MPYASKYLCKAAFSCAARTQNDKGFPFENVEGHMAQDRFLVDAFTNCVGTQKFFSQQVFLSGN